MPVRRRMAAWLVVLVVLLTGAGATTAAVLAEHLTTAGDALVTADRIVAALAPPHDLDGTPVTVSASVGVALNDDAGVEDILRAADEAMDRAKTAGKARAVLAAPTRP